MTIKKNMKKDYTKYLAATVGVIVTTAVVAGATYAYQGNLENFKDGMPFYENQQAIMEAIENKDYTSWKKIMDEQNAKMAEFITEENFNKIAALHEAMQSGDKETTQAIREELGAPVMGLGMFGIMGKGAHKGFDKDKGVTSEQQVEIQAAIESGDYEAWKTLMGDNPVTEKITAENFSKLAESHKLMQEGKFEEAKQIREELGLNFGRGGMGRFQKTQQ